MVLCGKNTPTDLMTTPHTPPVPGALCFLGLLQDPYTREWLLLWRSNRTIGNVSAITLSSKQYRVLMVLTHTSEKWGHELTPGMYFVTHVEHGNEEDWGIDDLELFVDEWLDWKRQQRIDDMPAHPVRRGDERVHPYLKGGPDVWWSPGDDILSGAPLPQLPSSGMPLSGGKTFLSAISPTSDIPPLRVLASGENSGTQLEPAKHPST